MPAAHDTWTSRRYLYLLAKLLFFGLIAGGVLWVLSRAASTLGTLVLALLIAYVLDPAVRWFTGKGLGRTTAILTLMLTVIGGAFGLLVWILPTLITEFKDAGERLHVWLGSDKSELVAWLNERFGLSLSPDALVEAKARLREYAPQLVGKLGGMLQGAGQRTLGAVDAVVSAVLVPVFVFYFLEDLERIAAFLVDLVPVRHRDAVLTRARRVDGVVGGWIRGQVQVALALAVVYASGLALVGIPIGVPIGILAGLLSVVPYLGFALGFGLALLVALLDWHGGGPVLGVAVVFIVGQLLEGYVLTPKLVGEKVGLSPVAVIIAILLGAEMLGFVGVLIAVPVTGALKALLSEALDIYRQSDRYRQPADVETEAT